MKKLLTLYFVFISGFVYAQSYKIPTIKTLGKSILDFVPSGWSVSDSIHGDLNKDKINDVVFVIIKRDSVKYYSATIEDTLKIIPRILVVAFNDNNGTFKKVEQNNSMLIDDNFPVTNQYPFEGIEIKNGVLIISFAFDYINSNFYFYTYKFRYQNSLVELIGADTCIMDRATSRTTGHSYNFITMKGFVTGGNSLEGSVVKEKEKWITLKLLKLKILKKLNPPGRNFEVIKGEFL
jgi:hypothetical protein